jgi:hypothetical protein
MQSDRSSPKTRLKTSNSLATATIEDAVQRVGNDRRQFQQLSDDARHLAMDCRDLANSVRQQLGGDQNLDPLHLECQHGCATLNVIADGLGNLGSVCGAS